MDELPDSWGIVEQETFLDLLGSDAPELMDDETLQMLFDSALFDRELDAETRAGLVDALDDYLWEEYGIDFELDFDWEAYREWYG